MTISITKAQLDQVETLLTRGEKADAVSEMGKIISHYFADVLNTGDAYEYALSEDEDKSSASYDIGNKFRTLLAKVRHECPDECKASTCELLNFQHGDRIYGFNRDESAVLYALGASVGEGNLVIDHVNDTFREGGVIDPTRSSAYSDHAWKDDADMPINEQKRVVNEYSQFYKALPKLAELPQKAVNVSIAKDLGVKMINRACKAGILKTVLDGATVHFNIDIFFSKPMVHEMAVTKGEKTTADEIEAFFTMKELRFVKRLVEIRPELGERVQFYQKGHKVDAPWVQYPVLWERYKRNENSKSLESILQTIAGANDDSKRQLVLAVSQVAIVVSSTIAEITSRRDLKPGQTTL